MSQKKKHDWASLQTYHNAHERVLNTYAKYMDRPRQYTQKMVTQNWMRLECLEIQFTTYNGNKVRVDISKDVEIDDSNPKRLMARTDSYRFNANEPRGNNLLRYDSPDPPAELGPDSPPHHRHHHKHTWKNGVEQITLIKDDQWPHVDEFLREVLTEF